MFVKRCVIGASSLCTTVVWNVWLWTTSLDVHCSRPHKRRRSSQQFKKLCACVSCLSSNCRFRVLAVSFDLIRLDLIAFLRRVSHRSAQDPFYFLRWFLFFKCLGRRFCQQSPRPCRNIRFPRFARGGAAVIADLFSSSCGSPCVQLTQDDGQQQGSFMSHIASAKVARARCRHVRQHQRRLVASRQSDSLRRIRSTRWRHLCKEQRTQGFRLEAELNSAAFDLDPSGGYGVVFDFLQACVDAHMNDVIGILSTKVGSTASAWFRAELRVASNDDECALVVFYRGWTTSSTHRRAR